MKFSHILWVVLTGVLGAGCSNIQNSRNLANPKVSATTLAQQVCSLCHGIDGRSTNPNFPNLAGQQPTYFMAQMKVFRTHNRLDPAGYEYMWGLSRSLTDDQIKGLADYYAAKAPAPLRGATVDPKTLAGGKAIFEQGVPRKGLQPAALAMARKRRATSNFRDSRISIQTTSSSS